MRFGDGLLEEILRRTDLVQLVGRRVKLVRRGRAMWGCCPFHGEKSPSFKVENERRAYKCFGCGAGGNAFKWVMETEGLSFPESVEKLAGEAGVALPKWSPEDEAREQKKKSLYDIIELACVFYEEQLRAPDARAARDYLAGRGLNADAIRAFRLGYAPNADALKNHLAGRNVTLDDMIAAGLVRPGQDGRGPRDFFFNRILFPIADGRGRVIAFGGRAMQADAKPKYINTGDTALFSKGHQLYNFGPARAAALKSGGIIVAEGYMDVIALARAGFEASVAPLGTALTEDQLQMLWRVAPEPLMAFDGDEAGLRAGLRAAHLALAHLKPGYSLRFAFLPPGEDPDSLVRSAGAPAMRKILDEAMPLAALLWRSETEGKDFSTPERRAGLERVLAALVEQIPDGTVAGYYRRDFDQRVFEAFKRRAPAQAGGWREGGRGSGGSRGPGGRRQAGPGRGGPIETVSPAVRASLLARGAGTGVRRVREEELARLVLEVPELALRHEETLAGLAFSDPHLDRLRAEILNLAASGARLDTEGLQNHLVRQGMAELFARLTGRRAGPDQVAPDKDWGAGHADDIDARFLRAAANLRELVDAAPERERALERFKIEATEEAWQDVRNLRGPLKE